jgi:hypothetical protein
MIDQATGEFLLVATIRLAVVLYLARLLVAGCRVIGRVPKRAEVLLWILGCAMYVIHVLCAFAFAHQWSHDVAFQYTADETQRLFGLRRGEGLWINYLFTLTWIFDAARLTIAFRRKRTTDRKLDIAVHSFMAFIVFNATVVFGPSLYRSLAIPIGLAMYACYLAAKPSST